MPISGLYGGEAVYDVEWLPDGSGFLFSKRVVGLGFFDDIYEYNFATKEVTNLTSFPADAEEPPRGLSISPDGKYIVFEREADPPNNVTSSLWIMNRDGTNPRKLADDAGRPAWGQAPAPLTPRAFLPVQLR